MVTKVVSTFDLSSEAYSFFRRQCYNSTMKYMALIHQYLINSSSSRKRHVKEGKYRGSASFRTQLAIQMGSSKSQYNLHSFVLIVRFQMRLKILRYLALT